MSRADRCPSRHPSLARRACDRGIALTTTLGTAATAIAAAALLTLLGGCASPGPQAGQPLAQPVQAAALGATGLSTPWPSEAWWRAWGDARLDALVERALAGQPSLAVATARARQAEAALGVAQAAQQPQVSLSADLTDQRFTANGMIPKPLAGSIYWNNNATLGASWELDLFGRQRAALEAAIGQQRAAQAEVQAARVMLAGNVAASYVQLARLVEQQALARRQLAQREQLLQLVRQRLAAGLDTRVEERQADAGIAQSRLEIAQLDENISRLQHALAELSGQGPEALADLRPVLATPPAQSVPAALPADLLGRRADLVAQRWRVESALRDVDVARAQFYPNINLSAFVGLSSLGLDRFLQAGSETYGIGPALRLPVFDGGRLRANLGARRAEVDAAVAGYDAALLRALREVADELGSLRALAAQQQAQAQASSAAEAALDLARQREQAGLGTRLAVLNAELSLLAQRRAALDLQARQRGTDIALIRALGGGWQAAGDSPPPAALAQAAPPASAQAH